MNVLQPEGNLGLRPAAAVLHAVDPTADTAAAADGTAAGSDVVVFLHLQLGSIAADEAAVEVDTHCSAVVEGIARGNRPAAVAAAAVVLDCSTCPSKRWPREPLRSMRTPCWAAKQASELDPMARCETLNIQLSIAITATTISRIKFGSKYCAVFAYVRTANNRRGTVKDRRTSWCPSLKVGSAQKPVMWIKDRVKYWSIRYRRLMFSYFLH